MASEPKYQYRLKPAAWGKGERPGYYIQYRYQHEYHPSNPNGEWSSWYDTNEVCYGSQDEALHDFELMKILLNEKEILLEG